MLIIHGGRVNKAYNRCLFTRLPGKIDWSAIVHINFMSTRQPGNSSLTLKSLIYFLIWRLKPPNQKIKKTFQRQRRLGLAGGQISFY